MAECRARGVEVVGRPGDCYCDDLGGCVGWGGHELGLQAIVGWAGAHQYFLELLDPAHSVRIASSPRVLLLHQPRLDVRYDRASLPGAIDLQRALFRQGTATSPSPGSRVRKKNTKTDESMHGMPSRMKSHLHALNPAV